MPYESNPLKVKVREIILGAFTNSETPLDAAEYEVQETGRWEITIRVKPERASLPRCFKIKLSEQL